MKSNKTSIIINFAVLAVVGILGILTPFQNISVFAQEDKGFTILELQQLKENNKKLLKSLSPAQQKILTDPELQPDILQILINRNKARKPGDSDYIDDFEFQQRYFEILKDFKEENYDKYNLGPVEKEMLGIITKEEKKKLEDLKQQEKDRVQKTATKEQPLPEPPPPLNKCDPARYNGEGFCLNVPIPGQTQVIKTPGQLISVFYKFAIGAGALLAIAVIIFGGIQYTLSAGNPAKIDDAKKWIFGAIWGFVLLLSAFLILFIIDPDLTKLKLTQQFKKIKPSQNEKLFELDVLKLNKNKNK